MKLYSKVKTNTNNENMITDEDNKIITNEEKI